ncbi:MAG: hypothetical protein KDA72_01285 [Planctomycetales bacterium]|nr:hypothetical protein [Planctomycetales bacterium]
MFDLLHSLDPSDWDAFRRLSHQALDDMLDYISEIRQRPVWQPADAATEHRFQTRLPQHATSLDEVYATFQQHILPFAVGNAHPGFMGWVHGGGNVVGMLAEMLAAGLNSNLGGRDHIPIAVEQQVVRWMAELFGFPSDASGLFVTGSSMANFIAVLVARTRALGAETRRSGMRGQEKSLVAYASTGTHGCVAKALDMSGLGSESLHAIGVNDQFCIDIDSLQAAIADDRAAGKQPFCVVGNAGTVDTGAIDDLNVLAELCQREQLWFHVDGACGALGMMSQRLRPRYAGIERADSLALDFHKWAQVPYDAGFVLVRDRRLHQQTFASPAAYLSRAERGMAAGSPWPCDYGPDLSRNFKALKVWFTLQVYGTQRLGRMMEGTCELARCLERRIAAEPELELLAPVSLNIVCFRYRGQPAASMWHDAPRRNELDRSELKSNELNALNSELVIALQESGIAAPSSTLINGQIAIRAALFNHRTTQHEVDALCDATLKFGRKIKLLGIRP